VRELDVSRFGSKMISLQETFHDIPDNFKGIIKAKQPNQLLFYGRLLSGQWLKDDKVFTANHSYYDSSTVKEYWDNNQPSERQYPFFSELNNSIKIYPIASPSHLKISVYANSKDGSKVLDDVHVNDLTSPSNEFVDFNVNSIIEKYNVKKDDVSSYGVKAEVIGSSKMPTRVGHQLVLGGGGLESSINTVLNNPNKFIAKGRKSMKWGQIVIGGGFDSFVGFAADSKENQEIEKHDVNIVYYNKTGKIKEKNVSVISGTSLKFSAEKELQDVINLEKLETPDYVWCIAESEKHGLNFFSCAKNKHTMHCSGDHGF